MSGKKYARKRQFSETLFQHISPLGEFPDLWRLGGSSKPSSRDNTSSDISSSDERSSPPHTADSHSCDCETALTAWGFHSVEECDVKLEGASTEPLAPTARCFQEFVDPSAFEVIAAPTESGLHACPELAFPLASQDDAPVKYLQIYVIPALSREPQDKPGVVIAHAFCADPIQYEGNACPSLPPSPPTTPALAKPPPKGDTSKGDTSKIQWQFLIVLVACTHAVGGLLFLTMTASFEDSPDAASAHRSDGTWQNIARWSEQVPLQPWQFDPYATAKYTSRHPAYLHGFPHPRRRLVTVSLYLLPLLCSIASTVAWRGFRSRKIEQLINSPNVRKCVVYTLLLRAFQTAWLAECWELSAASSIATYSDSTRCAVPAIGALNALWAFVGLAMSYVRIRQVIGRWLCVEALVRIVGNAYFVVVNMDHHWTSSVAASFVFWISILVTGATYDTPVCAVKSDYAKSG